MCGLLGVDFRVVRQETNHDRRTTTEKINLLN
jgi:hypothetical protein